MKTQKRVFWIVAIGLAVLLPTVGAVHAAAISTPFTGTEGSCIPIASGTATALPGGNFHIRGMVLECLDEATDPRAAGSNTVVINGNWGPDMAGPAWGSFRLVSGEGGVWSGTWAGMLTAGGFVFHAVGQGSGLYEGLRMFSEGAAGLTQGRILDPHGGP